MTTEDAIVELQRERDAFHDALAGVAPDSMTTPGLVGEWSARELIAHLGYWAGRAAETIHTVEEGRIADLDAEGPDVDGLNETVARIARQTDLATVRRREAASFEALVERLRSIDASLLSTRLPDGDTLADAVRVDGSNHYREHAEELRHLLAEAPRG